MKTNPRWVRIWIAASVVWGCLVIGFVLKLLATAPSFEVAASEPCTQLMLRPMPNLERAVQMIDGRLFVEVVVWRDARTGKRLSPWKGERSLSCTSLEGRAQLFLAGARAGIIEPQVHLRTRLLAAIIVLSSLLLAPVIYVCHLPFAGKR